MVSSRIQRSGAQDQLSHNTAKMTGDQPLKNKEATDPTAWGSSLWQKFKGVLEIPAQFISLSRRVIVGNDTQRGELNSFMETSAAKKVFSSKGKNAPKEYRRGENVTTQVKAMKAAATALGLLSTVYLLKQGGLLGENVQSEGIPLPVDNAQPFNVSVDKVISLASSSLLPLGILAASIGLGLGGLFWYLRTPTILQDDQGTSTKDNNPSWFETFNAATDASAKKAQIADLCTQAEQAFAEGLNALCTLVVLAANKENKVDEAYSNQAFDFLITSAPRNTELIAAMKPLVTEPNAHQYEAYAFFQDSLVEKIYPPRKIFFTAVEIGNEVKLNPIQFEGDKSQIKYWINEYLKIADKKSLDLKNRYSKQKNIERIARDYPGYWDKLEDKELNDEVKKCLKRQGSFSKPESTQEVEAIEWLLSNKMSDKFLSFCLEIKDKNAAIAYNFFQQLNKKNRPDLTKILFKEFSGQLFPQVCHCLYSLHHYRKGSTEFHVLDANTDNTLKEEIETLLQQAEGDQNGAFHQLVDKALSRDYKSVVNVLLDNYGSMAQQILQRCVERDPVMKNGSA